MSRFEYNFTRESEYE